MRFDPRWITGKTIAHVEMNPFPAREDAAETAHDPLIVFTDGSSIAFSAQETDFGTYGVGIIYRKAAP